MAAAQFGIHLKRAENVPDVRTNGFGQPVCRAIKIPCTKIGIQTGNLMNFEQIIDKLLFLENDIGALLDAAERYYELLCEQTGISDDSLNADDKKEKILSNGKAIAPKDAARCIVDVARTSKFIRGIYAAILKSKNEFPGEKIEILYAGCGPFAALALPLCAKFGANEISLTLIDVHARSIDSAKQVFEKYGFQNHVCEYIVADASFYRDSNGRRFHIIISETMQKTLEKEPQAAITLNLANQLVKNGCFIPQKITISACLANLQNEFGIIKGVERQRIPIGTILELSPESDDILSPKTLKIPEVSTSGTYFMLLTEILVFGDISLGDYESGITYPTILHDLSELRNGQKIKFRYEFGENPGLRYQVSRDAVNSDYLSL